MDIVNLAFKESLILLIDDKIIKLTLYLTLEEGNVKFGVEAPRSVEIHREEIYQALKTKKSEAALEDPFCG